MFNKNIKPGYENIAPGISADEDSKDSTSSSNNIGKPICCKIIILSLLVIYLFLRNSIEYL